MMRWIVKIGGYVVLAGCLAFLAQQVASQAAELRRAEISGLFVAVVAVSAVAYGGLQLLLVRASMTMLRGFGVAGLRFVPVLDWYGRSSIAKYLPGNVFHYVGRQVIATRYGWPQWAVATTSVVETALLAATAFALGLVLAALAGGLRLVASVDTGFAAVLPLVAVGALVLWGAGLFASRLPYVGAWPQVLQIERFSRGGAPLVAVACYAAFLLGAGALFWAVLAALVGDWSASTIPLALAGYVISWLIGYVTPAAPGGVGVREAVMVFLLAPAVGGGETLVLALAFRVVTILGDCLLFLGAVWGRRRG